jgi:outer membrane biogenesis lipoprotein LolB
MMKTRFCTILLDLAPLLLSACAATQKPEPEIKRAQPKPQEI